MPTPSQVEALRCVVAVRWPLLESYALARQDGMVEPVGLVIDHGTPFGRNMAQQLLSGPQLVSGGTRTVNCMERAILSAMLTASQPELAVTLRGCQDEPGRWVAVVAAERGWVLTGTWQELITAQVEQAARRGSRLR
jgi:hypothetical protein